MHGLGISRRIEQITKGTFQVKPGSLFPALHRMEEEGWITGDWGESENNRRARYYRLTKADDGNSKRRPSAGAGFRWPSLVLWKRRKEVERYANVGLCAQPVTKSFPQVPA